MNGPPSPPAAATSRRALLAATLAALGGGLAPKTARALGRKPYGGTLELRIPWPLDGLDPHAADDAAAALFGAAIADALYALDGSGRPYPALAASLPEPIAGGTRVLLRPNLRSARGVAMDARDVLFSLARAERAGAAGLLGPLGKPTPDPSEPLAVRFSERDPSAVASALASPLTAIVPRGYSRLRPDGTGAFLAEITKEALVLERNTNAARGAAWLQRVRIRPAADLAEALRAFEAGETDVSWIGEFLHKPRPGAEKLDAGPWGWVILRTGKDAGGWGAPGVAQKLLDALPAGRLAHLGLAQPSGGAGGDPAWGGEPAEVLVTEGATQLEQIGKELAAMMSRPAHELRVAVRPRLELLHRLSKGRYSLMLDFTRRIGHGPNADVLGLLTAASPALARKPPGAAGVDPRAITRTLPLGVVGQLRITGAHASGIRELSSWDLGAVWRR